MCQAVTTIGLVNGHPSCTKIHNQSLSSEEVQAKDPIHCRTKR